ncbi:MAG: hypothetical protein Q8Q12_12015 [bacterium]|nr:hypothetical protein [bacterium]
MLVLLGVSCIWQEPVFRGILVEEPVREVVEPQPAIAEEWILSQVLQRLPEILEDPAVHAVADKELVSHRETWGEETPFLDVFYGDYAVRLPVAEIERYPRDAMVDQLQMDLFGPVELKSGWLVWLGDVERADAISYDLRLAVRDTCNQLSSTGDKARDSAVRRFCDDFRKRFVFENDLGLYRQLWHSPFDVEDPLSLGAGEVLATFFLADLKRLIAPAGALERVVEVQTSSMASFEFGDETTPEGYSVQLFDDRNRITVLFLPPAEEGDLLDDGFRGKALASIRRHGNWVPGKEMIEKAESVLASQDVENARQVAYLLLFSSLQYPDHRTRAARMLLKMFTDDAPDDTEIIEPLRALAGEESS